jgi:protein SCO1/2
MNTLTWISVVLMSALLTGCDKPAAPSETQPLGANAAERIFETRGVIRSLPESGRTLVVRHEEIPDYMPRMTMELNVRDTNELAGLERDDEITFQLVATVETHWIRNIRRTGKATPDDPPAPARVQVIKELLPGDGLPDQALLAESGLTIRFSDFRGRALAFTFIFTRCPLPDFCPRMGNNFAKTRELLLATTNAPTNWQFLSISFDPDFDTPAVLRSYANLYRGGDSDRWLYAVAPSNTLAELAPKLDLMITREAGGGFSHNIRTVVLDPQGRIYKQLDGNEWTPAQLAAALAEAARISSAH